MNQIETFLRAVLWIHIAGGTSALLIGMGAILTKKGSPIHRNFGKVYFWSMTIVFVGALTLAIGHHLDFLMMVAFFSYYMTVRGYRILFLKKLNTGQKPVLIDWIIIAVSSAFISFLFIWGAYEMWQGKNMGIVGLVFGTIGASFLYQDIKSFIHPPQEKMHWWYGHIAGMGGSYISAITAFIVVNIQIGQFNWALWILPAFIGGSLIGRSIRFYKLQFSGKTNRLSTIEKEFVH